MKKKLTQKRLKEALNYNKKTGLFTWKIRKQNIQVGSVAGCNDNGYTTIGLDGYKYSAHVLAWFYVEGYWPENIIDHRNRIRNDNRWLNLRHTSYICNAINIAIPKNNKSGVKGVCYEKGRDKWRADIQVYGRSKKLGRFNILVDAVMARYKAEVEYNFYKCDSDSSAFSFLSKRSLI